MFASFRAFCLAAAIGCMALSPARAQTTSASDEGHVGNLPTWKTISLGTYASATAMLAALDAASVHVGDTAEAALHRPAFVVGRTQTDVQLVVVSAAELGFDGRASLGAIYTRASKFGYEPCPPEVAVQLRLHYRDQPVGEFLDIAMQPVPTYGGDLIDLTVANGGAGLMLVGAAATLDTLADPALRFVFVRPVRVAGSAP